MDLNFVCLVGKVMNIFVYDILFEKNCIFGFFLNIIKFKKIGKMYNIFNL